MAQARIYWDRDHYVQVEKLFRQSSEFCSEHDAWKLNVAHVFFMQQNKFKEVRAARAGSGGLVASAAHPRRSLIGRRPSRPAIRCGAPGVSACVHQRGLTRHRHPTRAVCRPPWSQAIHYYQPLVKKMAASGSVLDVTGIVLANLCVAYIMTSQNEQVRGARRDRW